MAIACGLVGFADDYTKIVKRRSLGLRGAHEADRARIAISLGLWWVARSRPHLPNSCACASSTTQIDLGVFYPVLIYLVVAGTTSAVNLTDGLDGLAAGCAAIVLLAFIGITFITTGQRDLALLSARCLVGGCIGFLWFNCFPAPIFMGDTGSLALGGAIAGLAVMTKTEILLIILGGIFVIEALSVAIQVFAVPGVPQARLPDGPGPPPLRADGLVGDQDHPALLDRRGGLQRDRLHDLPEQHRLAQQGAAAGATLS